MFCEAEYIDIADIARKLTSVNSTLCRRSFQIKGQWIFRPTAARRSSVFKCKLHTPPSRATALDPYHLASQNGAWLSVHHHRIGSSTLVYGTPPTTPSLTTPSNYRALWYNYQLLPIASNCLHGTVKYLVFLYTRASEPDMPSLREYHSNRYQDG